MKARITVEEWEKIEEESSAAKYFLENKRFEFIRNYISEMIRSAHDLIVENRILETREELTISDRLKRVLITPKKQQVDELVGSYKSMKKFLSDIQRFADLKDELEKEAEKKKIIIERGKE